MKVYAITFWWNNKQETFHEVAESMEEAHALLAKKLNIHLTGCSSKILGSINPDWWKEMN